MLAVPWQAVPEVLAEAGDLAGKVLIDCTNALKWDAQGPIWAVPAAEEIARQRPAARVVKAFNTLGAEHLGRLGAAGTGGKGGEGSTKPDTFICGDDEAARQVVRSLGEEIGFGVVDAGPLRNARVLEHLAVLWIHLAMKGGLGRDIFFKVMRPAI
jgi:predicted dinucleotide-binding enzyme